MNTLSTWWSVVSRDDLGLDAKSLSARPFSITNRAWYVLHRFLVSMGARGTDLLVEKETFLSSRLLVHWGQCIAAIAPDHW